MRFLPVNLNALLVELDGLEQTLSLLDSLNACKIPGVEELVPAACTILVIFRPEAVSSAEIVRDISRRNVMERITQNEVLIEIPVHYNGDDLDEVAQILGISTQEVINRHTQSEYTVAFTGFAPGFAYLSGGHPSLDVPRRATPRTRLPAGAVGLAGTFSGVYPQASPGGWQIIGVTQAKMWDLERAVPALLQPGFRVRFVDVQALPLSEEARMLAECAGAKDVRDISCVCSREQCESVFEAQLQQSYLKVVFPGIQTVLQDRGRFGKAGQGVCVSGALDQGALRSANRLVGNPSDMACLENVYGGLKLECVGQHAVVAVTGADVPVTVQTAEGYEQSFSTYEAIALSDGDRLLLGAPAAGIRAYVAVRGGFDIEPVLDSFSADTLACVGPEPLAAEDMLPVRAVLYGNAVDCSQERFFSLPKAPDVVTLDVVLGPRTDWFTPEAVALLSGQLWEVTPQSNRVGIRLAGERPLERAHKAELPSEGTSLGAIQVPSGGQPVLFLADHPLTGGYPVIGSVATYHLDLAGQIPVGCFIRFNPITVFEDLSEKYRV